MLYKITILGGRDRDGCPEPISRLEIHPGEVLAVVGPAGSGKRQLITDIRRHRQRVSPAGRRVFIHETPPLHGVSQPNPRGLVAEVSAPAKSLRNMAVNAFLRRRAGMQGIQNPDTVVGMVLAIANQLADDPISPTHTLPRLSSGQTRALMVGDAALISCAPVVLVNEIENSGIDRLGAMAILSAHGKLVLVITHDPALILMAGRRVVMKNGGMVRFYHTTSAENAVMEKLVAKEKELSRLREALRSGRQMTPQAARWKVRNPWPVFHGRTGSASKGSTDDPQYPL